MAKFVTLMVWPHGHLGGGGEPVVINADLIRAVGEGTVGGYRATVIEWIDGKQMPLYSPLSVAQVQEALNR